LDDAGMYKISRSLTGYAVVCKKCGKQYSSKNYAEIVEFMLSHAIDNHF